MAVTFKCKMCNGVLNIIDNSTICECEFCGTRQTIPHLDDEKKIRMFNRASRLRFDNEFDSAISVFENIVAEFPKEAEAYWGLCLCKYGIEYVDDPKTGKKTPTCHRANYDSILDDDNYIQACKNADAISKQIYHDEAMKIDHIQQSILEIAKNEKPFDIFICYKEKSDDGQRTKDSVIAQNIYDALTEKGYKVFFARVTLESKLGQAYEPYIFSALNSSRIMLVVGTNYEHFNAIWVKNEWSRFLKMLNEDKSKVIYPCYADIEPDDMPREFKNLPKQNMQKVGFLQDLIHGIGKIISPEGYEQKTVQHISGPNVDNLLKRGFMALEDGKWNEAERCFNKVLDETAECSQAYLGKTMIYYKVNHIEQLCRIKDLPYNSDFKRAVQFSSGMEKEQCLNIQNECIVFFKDEDRRVNMIVDIKNAQASHIGMLETTLQESKNQYEVQMNEVLKKPAKIISRKGCMIPLFIFLLFAGYIFRLLVYKGELDQKAGESAVITGFIVSIVAIIVVRIIGLIIHNVSTKKNYQHLEKKLKEQEQNLLTAIQAEKNKFICYRCGSITNTGTNICEICGCEYRVQVEKAIYMNCDEFIRNVLSDNVIPQNHDFMK